MKAIQLVSMLELGPIIESVVEKGSEITVVISGNSMYPMLSHRRTKVTLAKATSYKKYDVILYKRTNGQYVLHRIIGKKNDACILAGDNETEKEFPIQNEQIIACVKAFERFGRKIYTNQIGYRVYTVIWCAVFPFRHKLIRFAKYIWNGFLKKTEGRYVEK